MNLILLKFLRTYIPLSPSPLGRHFCFFSISLLLTREGGVKNRTKESRGRFRRVRAQITLFAAYTAGLYVQSPLLRRKYDACLFIHVLQLITVSRPSCLVTRRILYRIMFITITIIYASCAFFDQSITLDRLPFNHAPSTPTANIFHTEKSGTPRDAIESFDRWLSNDR